MGIFDFGGLGFWLFAYGFDWWNESMVLFFFFVFFSFNDKFGLF